MQNGSFEHCLAMDEEPYSPVSQGSEVSSDRSAAVEATDSERSFDSSESHFSIMLPDPTADFHEHVARGTGGGRSIRTSLTDNMMDDLNEAMTGSGPIFEDATEHERPRRVLRWLEALPSGISPEPETYENLAYNVDAGTETHADLIDKDTSTSLHRSRFLLLVFTLVVGSTILALASTIGFSDFIVLVLFFVVMILVAAMIIVS